MTSHLFSVHDTTFHRRRGKKDSRAKRCLKKLSICAAKIQSLLIVFFLRIDSGTNMTLDFLNLSL